MKGTNGGTMCNIKVERNDLKRVIEFNKWLRYVREH